MIRGIGVDTVTISEIDKISKQIGAGSLARIFSAEELAYSCESPDSAAYLATRFAAKEAVFKADAHLLEDKHFDLRIVETFNRDDGSPYIHVNDRLQEIWGNAGVSKLLISITTEGDLATAFVVAE